MISMNSTDTADTDRRHIQFEGTIHYFKNGWISTKWITVYAKLWSDSMLEWFQDKDSVKPIGSIQLNSVIPYFCIGPRIKNVPTKKPKMKATWNRNLLMAIATDIQAATVYWFYFCDNNNFVNWIHEITQTLPRVIISPRNCLNHEIHNDKETNSDRDYANLPSNSPKLNALECHNDNIIVKDSQLSQKGNNFDKLFNETFQNYGIGEFFFPMTVDSSSSDYESDESDSDENEEEYANNKNATAFCNNNLCVSKDGKKKVVTSQNGADFD